MLNARWKSVGDCVLVPTPGVIPAKVKRIWKRWNLFEPLNGDCYIVSRRKGRGSIFNRVIRNPREDRKEDFSSFNFCVFDSFFKNLDKNIEEEWRLILEEVFGKDRRKEFDVENLEGSRRRIMALCHNYYLIVSGNFCTNCWERKLIRLIAKPIKVNLFVEK